MTASSEGGEASSYFQQSCLDSQPAHPNSQTTAAAGFLSSVLHSTSTSGDTQSVTDTGGSQEPVYEDFKLDCNRPNGNAAPSSQYVKERRMAWIRARLIANLSPDCRATLTGWSYQLADSRFASGEVPTGSPGLLLNRNGNPPTSPQLTHRFGIDGRPVLNHDDFERFAVENHSPLYAFHAPGSPEDSYMDCSSSSSGKRKETERLDVDGASKKLKADDTHVNIEIDGTKNLRVIQIEREPKCDSQGEKTDEPSKEVKADDNGMHEVKIHGEGEKEAGSRTVQGDVEAVKVDEDDDTGGVANSTKKDPQFLQYVEQSKEAGQEKKARIAIEAWKKFHHKHYSIPTRLRNLLRLVPSFIPECGNVSRIEAFVKAQNDLTASLREWNLTGTPYETDNARVVSLEGGVLTCGCQIENSLLDFYLFKTGRLWSPSKLQTEDWRSQRNHPRARELILTQIKSETLWNLDNIWCYKADDTGEFTVFIPESERLRTMLERQTERLVEIQEKEKQAATEVAADEEERERKLGEELEAIIEEGRKATTKESKEQRKRQEREQRNAEKEATKKEKEAAKKEKEAVKKEKEAAKKEKQKAKGDKKKSERK
ncbi:hypothetical protein BT96DRAFT_998907 [Gymnopus androsaceus JB14]|uniref:Uncharacterized protein n=1 Tax=Gymnopus androsaceus JB14 TaxID=1447944 RepID=A0A6A4H8F7_9AGAR|nr:hypothetical protein BT96DRAFT_998907 [Gymnopus androsaceus JB14]